jgi:hypothetical protein
MKNSIFLQIPGIVLFPVVFFLDSDPLCAQLPAPTADTASFFLYVDYYGSRYDRGIQRVEYYIKVVKLPAHLLKKMPRLKNYGYYSEKNNRILCRQQDLIRPYRGNNMVIRIDQKKLNEFYPGGLKKGFIIEETEFLRWDFIRKPPQQVDPARREKPDFDESLYFDPLDLYCKEINITWNSNSNIRTSLKAMF